MMQAAASLSTTTGSSATTDWSDVSVTASTTMIDIHTVFSNPQPTLEPTPNTINAYNIIGIKNQCLHLFLSAASLSSLSVIALIEYFMAPPVPNAIQGAYFVAAFLTGLIFGAMSLIFKELTEGRVKRGGLVASPETRGAFIGAFCAAFYALSFSPYTRPYGLILSTAFAGSTIAVLGIDCFSRAGWKEFWLYIWGLNDNLFPLSTSTYPVTRGFRVELAVTVVVCLLGLLSQFRLWKVIGERRKKQEESSAEERRIKDEAEVEVGRALQEKKENDLVRWEPIYGHKGNCTTSQTPGSEAKTYPTPVEPVEAPDNAMEMADLTTSSHNTNDEDIIEEKSPENDRHDVERETANEQDRIAESHDVDEEYVNANDESNSINEQKAAVSSTPSPSVTPCPFRVPQPENNRAIGYGDGQSIQVIIDDIDTASVGTSKRLSAASLFRRLAHRKSVIRRRSRLQSKSDEILVPIHPASSTYSDKGIEDSDAGSDHEDAPSIDIDNVNPPRSDSVADEGDDKTLQEGASSDTAVLSPTPPDPGETEISRNVKSSASQGARLEAQEEKVPLMKDKTSTESRLVDAGLGISTDKRRHTVDGATTIFSIAKAPSPSLVHGNPSKPTQTNTIKEAKAKKSITPLSIPKSKSSSAKNESLTSDVVKRIPSHVSSIVMSYRTNEWAKRLSHADAPEPEPLENLTVDTERPISPDLIELAAPLNVDELKQTALTVSPPPMNEKRKSLFPERVIDATVQQSTSSTSRRESGDASPRDLVFEHPENAKTSLTPTFRKCSHQVQPSLCLFPLLSAAVATQGITHNSARKSTQGQGAEEESQFLMAQRERLIQARLSSVSLTHDSLATRNKLRHSLEGMYQSRPGSQLSMVGDMPLAQRRSLLQQRVVSPILALDIDAPRSPVDKTPPIGARISRESSKSKVSAMVAWRESLQEDFSKYKPLVDVDIAQNELMEQQRKAQLARNQRLQVSENLHNSIAERMRRGDMQDLHREAMRRMQAAANRKVTNGPR
ncbi:conserved hypothetical protein [Talaromyces stipitatus ATCC 10500]|uniref:TM7S3/TM198-like domain-containing protein n=1 Tax=Talaromyces stipitatus (strain ATCC 10500 / CBS 375.48 / QM 6759 / NRRL 1006) TaxID=441959 RepID=B8MQ10_TALSN|nr:uncharacterized protein TSTA_054120 [Talaromyces stipitatus ATCC 10500]EED12900.1 conserved hypothetical protein [Talaromyces stipitatus ATCC 10500]